MISVYSAGTENAQLVFYHMIQCRFQHCLQETGNNLQIITAGKK